jgi:hypothetical protein
MGQTVARAGGNMSAPTKTYIGDSVYAEISDGRVKLTTDNGYPDDPRNVIYLEPEVWTALVAFMERISADG